MNIPIQQHFVPTGYLQFFADHKDQVSVYRRSDEPGTLAHRFTANIRKVGKKRHLYSLDIPSGKDARVEYWLQNFDSILPAVLEIVDRGHALEADMIEGLKFLTAVQQCRGHRGMELLEEEVQARIDRLARRYKEKYPRRSGDAVKRAVAAKIREEWHIKDHAVPVTAENVARLELDNLINQRARILGQLHCCIAVSTGRTFMTSDSPVAAFDPARGNAEGVYGIDETSPNVETIYPLTKTRALVLVAIDVKRQVSVDDAFVRQLNARTVMNAKEDVYAYPSESDAEERERLKDIRATRRRRSIIDYLRIVPVATR